MPSGGWHVRNSKVIKPCSSVTPHDILPLSLEFASNYNEVVALFEEAGSVCTKERQLVLGRKRCEASDSLLIPFAFILAKGFFACFYASSY